MTPEQIEEINRSTKMRFDEFGRLDEQGREELVRIVALHFDMYGRRLVQTLSDSEEVAWAALEEAQQQEIKSRREEIEAKGIMRLMSKQIESKNETIKVFEIEIVELRKYKEMGDDLKFWQLERDKAIKDLSGSQQEIQELNQQVDAASQEAVECRLEAIGYHKQLLEAEKDRDRSLDMLGLEIDNKDSIHKNLAEAQQTIARQREALNEVKGDIETINSWNELPETLVTWVKQTVLSIDVTLGGNKEGSETDGTTQI